MGAFLENHGIKLPILNGLILAIESSSGTICFFPNTPKSVEKPQKSKGIGPWIVLADIANIAAVNPPTGNANSGRSFASEGEQTFVGARSLLHCDNRLRLEQDPTAAQEEGAVCPTCQTALGGRFDVETVFFQELNRMFGLLDLS